MDFMNILASYVTIHHYSKKICGNTLKQSIGLIIYVMNVNIKQTTEGI